MHGTNPIRPPETGDGLTLKVQHIFPTIQGEGPHAGVPAIFIRLGGCNLACDFCDTEFESFRAMGLEVIMEKVETLAHPTPSFFRQRSKERGLAVTHPLLTPLSEGGANKLIVITGGEPLRQPIGPLCEALIEAGYTVQIETNGTLWRPLPDAVEIVCSPKNNGMGYFPLRPDLLARANAIKFIISAQKPGYGDVADIGQGNVPIYVQPMDEYDEARNAANVKRVMELARRYGYRLSLQLHKILEIE